MTLKILELYLCLQNIQSVRVAQLRDSRRISDDLPVMCDVRLRPSYPAHGVTSSKAQWSRKYMGYFIRDSWTLRGSNVLGCGGVSLAVWSPTFRKTVETSVNTHPSTQSITSQKTWSLPVPLSENLERLQFEINPEVHHKSDPLCSQSSQNY